MDTLVRRARFSRCRRFRTVLGRVWNPSLPLVGFVGLNPSTADAHRDDPTLRRCVGFGRRMDAGGIVLVNLFGYRATRPADLWQQEERVGPSTDRVMRTELRECREIVVCWGNLPAPALGRAQRVLANLDRWGHSVVQLGLTRGGHPRHPLYTRADAPIRSWDAATREPPYRADTDAPVVR